MSILSGLRDRFITTPVAKQILDSVKTDQPSIFAVPTGFNSAMSSFNRRMTSSSIDFATLRALSINHETTRVAINTRKRQISQLGWEIANVDPDVDAEKNLKERQAVKQIVNNIGGQGVRFRYVVDKLLEDILVLDACVFYKQRERSGKLIRIVPIDGATIKLRVDQSGATPLPPEIAYEQWIRGQKTAEMTTDELYYDMMNPRNDSPYGLSPIESMLISIDSSMRAMLYNLNYLSDNNIPQGFISMPEGWTVQQIKEYKEWFDAMVSGSKATAKVYPIPSGAAYQATSKPTDFSFQDFFNYLDTKVAIMFDLAPQELGLNLKQYKENAEGQEKIQIRKGIKPLANFIQEIFNDLIQKDLGFPDFAFKFTGLDGRWTANDMSTLIPLGVIGIDEARNDLALKKIGVGNVVINAGGITPVDMIQANADASLEAKKNPPQALQNDQTDTNTKKLAKAKQNTLLDKLEGSAQFSKFKKSIKKGLTDQIKPFTEVAKIDKVTMTKKAVDSSAIEDNIDEELPSIEISGLEDYLKWAAKQGGQNAYDKLNVDGVFSLKSEDFKRLLGDRSNYLIESLDNTTKNYLIDLIVNGKDEGLTNEQIASKISDDIDDISDERADMIVRTEVANATMQAELGVYEEQGIEKYTWELSEDIGDECGENADAGAIAVGDTFPSGDDAPPAHPNCRCFLNAVVE